MYGLTPVLRGGRFKYAELSGDLRCLRCLRSLVVIGRPQSGRPPSSSRNPFCRKERRAAAEEMAEAAGA